MRFAVRWTVELVASFSFDAIAVKFPASVTLYGAESSSCLDGVSGGVRYWRIYVMLLATDYA